MLDLFIWPCVWYNNMRQDHFVHGVRWKFFFFKLFVMYTFRIILNRLHCVFSIYVKLKSKRHFCQCSKTSYYKWLFIFVLSEYVILDYYYNRWKRLLSCRFNNHGVKLKYDLRRSFRCNWTWESFQMDFCLWLSWSTTTIMLRRTCREGHGFRLISIVKYLTSSHCQEVSPREFYIRHKTDGEVNYYLKLNP